ncbi:MULTISPECIES: MmpS family transport accessory protein [Streptomyces]|uniref:MmpS family transport accessory protein n=1 Tax=Streptomyces chengmaiensis TaxID=3040919 RepID=A0ABT6HL44_9ACTN|nr:MULTISPECIES: MmpS family transport accessory protein [Streptomyces]MDH2389012.1 MmpS family transport accessory protein [Streptomyces chengmaiensis]WRQ82706.1 MmpS family transport accessory protein [Streptomyces sp. MUM 178J]
MVKRTRNTPMALGIVLAVAAVAGLAVAVLVGRPGFTWLKELRGGNGWYLTYEASADGEGGPGTGEIAYTVSPDRFEGALDTQRVSGASLPWSGESVVNTGDVARVVITPQDGRTASCRIMLDGVREVASGISPAPGEPAVCEVKTSEEPEHWPSETGVPGQS